MRKNVADNEDYSDPISTLLNLNEQMLKRIPHLRYIVNFAYVASLTIVLASTLAMVIMVYLESEIQLFAMALILFVVSLPALFFSYKNNSFINKYEMLASAVSRTMKMDPNPSIPEGSDPMNRIVNYLVKNDERFGYFYKKNPATFQTNVELKGKSKQTYHFDGYFESSSYPWDRIRESVSVMIRAKPFVTTEDILKLKAEAEDILSNRWVTVANLPFLKRLKFKDKPETYRIILVQTEDPNFSEEVVMTAIDNEIKYGRFFRTNEYDWTIQIELIAEDHRNKLYNLGGVYFG